MASYLQIYNRRTADGELLARYEVAVVKYAVYCRDLGGGASQAQQDWFQGALDNPAAKVQAMAWELAFNPVIADAVSTSGITDEQIQAAVEAVALKY